MLAWISTGTSSPLISRHGFSRHPHVHVEAHGVDVPVLLAAQQVAGAAQLEVERGDLEARAQVAELLERPPRRFRASSLSSVSKAPGGRRRRGRWNGPPSPKLVEFAQPVALGVLMTMVLASGMSRPFSMMVGAHQDVAVVVHEAEHHLLELGLAHLAVAHADPGRGRQLLDLGRGAQMESTRLCRK